MRSLLFPAHSAMAVAIAGLFGILASPGCKRPGSLPAEDLSRLTIQLRSPAFSDSGQRWQQFCSSTVGTRNLAE
jgi:hypothetical protein